MPIEIVELRALVLVLLLGMAAAPGLPPRRPSFHPQDEVFSAVQKITAALQSMQLPGGFRLPALKSPFFGSMHMFRPGPPQQISETHPTTHEVQRTVRWPICVFNRAALLGTFCVDKTTSLMEKDPANLLPRISFNIEPEKPSKATVFLINDNHGAFQRAFPFAGSGSNRTAGCEAVMEASTATIFASTDTGRVVGSRSLRGSEPTKWVAVAVDCSHPRPTCPNISEAVITMYHPNSESEPDSCRFSSQGALEPLMQLRELMSEVSEMKWPDPLQVVGVGQFGVAMLYLGFMAMMSCAMLFGLLSRMEPDETKKQMHLRSCFAVTWMGLCYLGAAILAPVKWVYWVLACCAFSGLHFVITRRIAFQALIKERPTRRLFQKLSLLILGCWSCYPILWLFCDGARALSSDAALSLYTCLDILSHCICGLMLVRNVRASPDFLMKASGAASKDEETLSMLHSDAEDVP